MPGEGRPPIGSIKANNAKEGLNLLLTAHTAYYTARTALIKLKVALAQRVIEQAEHLEQQVYTTTDLPTKIDLTMQADALYSKVVTVLFDLMREDEDALRSMTKTNAN